MGDKILQTLNELVQKWMQPEVKLKVFDNPVQKKPSFISLTFKEKKGRIVCAKNGALSDDKTIDEKGFLADVFIGGAEGLGRYTYGEEELPKDETAMKRVLDRTLDSSLKEAVSDYLKQKGDSQARIDPKIFFALSKEPVVKSISSYLKQEDDLISEKGITRLAELTGIIYKETKPIIEQVEACIKFEDVLRRYVNSEGTQIRSHSFRGRCKLEIIIKGKDSAIIEHAVYIHLAMNPSQMKKFEYLNGRKVNSIINHINALANAPLLESGHYPVFLNGKAFYIFFHEALAAHLLSGKYIYEGESNVFADKIGKQIMPSFLTIIDDPTYRNGFGHIVYDEEGVQAQRAVLVENGVLKNFLLDRPSAGKLKLHSNGHARSEWVIGEDEDSNYVTLIPEPRITNVFIQAPSGVSEQGLMKKIMHYCEKKNHDFGLYIDSGSGYVDPETGEFELYPNRLYKIYPNGNKELVTGAYLHGSPYYLLDQITCCSNTYSFEQGFCDSLSGVIPVAGKAPSAFLKEVSFNKISPTRLTKRILPKIA
ncbi:hypothetical protein AYK26_05405 [Euryarchaeota archaeon SM23-78]|nr:MAG: hypothetical protein AYK26_05405 [Euryarchaeota archaeon SM23-78]MBW3001038.1 TldD/PmbA family protein [Candidatus Woesearchaeota archaeon]